MILTFDNQAPYGFTKSTQLFYNEVLGGICCGFLVSKSIKFSSHS